MEFFIKNSMPKVVQIGRQVNILALVCIQGSSISFSPWIWNKTSNARSGPVIELKWGRRKFNNDRGKETANTSDFKLHHHISHHEICCCAFFHLITLSHTWRDVKIWVKEIKRRSNKTQSKNHSRKMNLETKNNFWDKLFQALEKMTKNPHFGDK